MAATLTRRLDRGNTDLARRVRNFLQSQTNPELRALEVEADQDVVVVRGRVGSPYAQQLATECCGRVAGVRRVVNETKLLGA